MPLPEWLAEFNKGITNRVTRPVAHVLPWFGVVLHRGRNSGHRYRTPVNVFRHDNRYIIALTYGRDRDWVRNVCAAGGCDLETRGNTVHLSDPRIVIDPLQNLVPPAIRPILKLIGVAEFMELSP